MKVIVRKRFRDRDTLAIHNAGEEVEYDNDRASELVRARFVAIVGEDSILEEDEAPTSDGDDKNTDEEDDTTSSEKKEKVNEPSEKSETTHTPKAETSKPNKPGRKPIK